jgi:two-component system, sensor histidine kinase and response regulator
MTRIDMDTALGRLGGDRTLLRDMAAIYLEDSNQMIESVEKSVAEGDLQEVEHRVHALKGLAATFEPADLVEPMQDLITGARKGELPEVRRLWRQCRPKLDGLQATLLDLLRAEASNGRS